MGKALKPYPLPPQKKSSIIKEKMKKLDFPTKYSESVEKGTFETFSKPSMTEPDNALSIPEIIARFTRGLPLNVTQHPWESGTAFEGDTPDDFFKEEREAFEAQNAAQQQESKPESIAETQESNPE